MMTGLECGHRFCTQCWCEYLTTKIMEEGLVRFKNNYNLEQARTANLFRAN